MSRTFIHRYISDCTVSLSTAIRFNGKTELFTEYLPPSILMPVSDNILASGDIQGYPSVLIFIFATFFGRIMTLVPVSVIWFISLHLVTIWYKPVSVTL